MDQVAGDDLAHAVRQPAGGGELAHAGVDEGVAGTAGAPALERLGRLRRWRGMRVESTGAVQPAPLLKVQEELGELTAEHLRMSGRARGAADAGKLGDEAADVLGMLLIYCDRAGIDIEAAMQRKWLHWLDGSRGED